MLEKGYELRGLDATMGIRPPPTTASQPKMSKTQNLVAPGGMFGSALSDGAGECSGEIEFLQKEAWY